MPRGWEWDETLYAGAAGHYAGGRFGYPTSTGAAFGAQLPVPAGRLLDVGCGPGSFTLSVAGLFDAVVGIDADAGMLAQARAAVADAGHVQWHRMRAEELPGDLGEFDVVSFAQSFHWLDRVRTAGVVRRMLRPPHPEIDVLVRHYLGPVRRAGQGTLPHGDEDDEDDVLRAAGFGGPQSVTVPSDGVLERTEDQVVAAVFSVSGSVPHLFGECREQFEVDLRSLLRRHSPSGRFSERARDVTMQLWRPCEPGA